MMMMHDSDSDTHNDDDDDDDDNDDDGSRYSDGDNDEGLLTIDKVGMWHSDDLLLIEATKVRGDHSVVR